MLHDTVTSLASAIGREVSSVAVVAAGDSVTVCAVVLTWSGLDAEPLSRLPDGVKGLSWEAPPRTLYGLPSRSLDEIHEEACASAWMLGAWDIAVLVRPPVLCRGLPVLPGGVEDVHGFAEPIRLWADCEGLRTWRYRPMILGPSRRRAAWAGKDATLAPPEARPLHAMPAVPPPPAIGDRARQLDILLGRSLA